MPTTYYIRKTGSDAAAGTSPGAAWLTLGKALGASGMASGDTCYVGGGVYREAVTAALTAPTVDTFIIGDTTGEFTGDSGLVFMTPYVTNDKTAPVSTAPLILSGKDFLNFTGIIFIGGNNSVNANGTCVSAITTTKELKFRTCSFYPGSSAGINLPRVVMTPPVDVASNILFDGCLFWENADNGTSYALKIFPPTSASADYDMNFQITNCLFLGVGGGILLSPTGAAAFKPGGMDVSWCTIMSAGSAAVLAANASCSTSIPSTVYNCILFSKLQANASGQIVEDYNLIHSSTARTNVSAGTHSIADGSYAMLFSFGQEFQAGYRGRPMFTPFDGSPILGFGNSGSRSTDFLGRLVPAGGGSTSPGIGYLERHDTAIKEVTTTDAGSVGLVIVGPGDHEIKANVDATATVLTIKARYDTNHAATNKPQVQLVAEGFIGVAAETKTMTAAVDTWETLTFSSFTPTAKGVVTLRLISRSAAGNGKAFFDTAG